MVISAGPPVQGTRGRLRLEPVRAVYVSMRRKCCDRTRTPAWLRVLPDPNIECGNVQLYIDVVLFSSAVVSSSHTDWDR